MCNVCERQLRRFLHDRFGKPIHPWFLEHRMRRANHMLMEGTRAKDVGDNLGYKQASHFSTDFKRFFGFRPSDASKLGLEMARSPLSITKVRY